MQVYFKLMKIKFEADQKYGKKFEIMYSTPDWLLRAFADYEMI